MTIEQYGKEIQESLLIQLGRETQEHFDSLNPEKRTRDYWLTEVRDALVPSRKPVYKLKLRGYNLEIWTDKFECVASFGCEILYVGGRQITIESLEEALDTLRFLVGRLPSLMKEYRTQMDNAEMEIKKINMVSDICLATAKSQLDGAIKPGDRSTFRYSITRKDIIVKFRDWRTDKTKMFRLNYDKLTDDISRVKTWYETEGPGGDPDYVRLCSMAVE